MKFKRSKKFFKKLRVKNQNPFKFKIYIRSGKDKFVYDYFCNWVKAVNQAEVKHEKS